MSKHKYYYDERQRLHELPDKKPKRLPPHVIRKINMAPKGPGFVCPECKERFRLEYGSFGKMRWIEEPRYYCKDCAKAPRFTRLRK